MSQVIEFEGQQHEFPDDFNDADIAKALGGDKTAAPAQPPQPEESGLRKAAGIVGKNIAKIPERALGEAKGAVQGAVDAVTTSPSWKTALTAGLGPGSTVVTRLGALAAGSMLDKPSTDWWENVKTAGKGVVGDWQKPMSMLTSPAAMEAVLPAAGKVAGKVFRSTAPGARAVNAADAERVGGAMEAAAPTLKPGTTANAMQRTAEGPGLARIGQGKEAAIQEIERVIGGRPISVPTVSDAPLPLRAANAKLSEIGDMMRGFKPLDPRYANVDLKQLYGQVSEEIKRGIADAEFAFQRGLAGGVRDYQATATRRALPPAGGSTVQPSSASGYEARPFTQREGNERTLEAGSLTMRPPEGDFIPRLTPSRSLNEREMLTPRQLEGGPYHVGETPITPQPRVPGGPQALVPPSATPPQPRFNVPARETINQGQTSLGAGLWTQAQGDYRSGRAITEMLSRPNAFKQGEFNAQDLQRWLKNPENRADLARSLGGDLATGQNLGPYNKLVDAITRGAGAGMVDKLAGEAPGFFSGRGSYGSWRAPVEIIRRAFPHASDRLVGRVPFSPAAPSPVAQTIADVMAERTQ